MNQTAKKGDLAVIVGANKDRSNVGRVVRVLTDPEMVLGALEDGTPLEPRLANEVDIQCPWTVWPYLYVETKWLVPIADPDAGITRTTEREVAA